MNDNAKCFIFVNGEYKEIPYKKLKKMREIDTSYRARRFLLFHGMLMEVMENDFIEYQKHLRHHRYLAFMASQFSNIPFHDIYTIEHNIPLSGEESIRDENVNIEDTVVHRVMVHRLLEGLKTLPQNEQSLIEALYMKGFTEREWSKISGIPQKTINEKKGRILFKLLKFIENQK